MNLLSNEPHLKYVVFSMGNSDLIVTEIYRSIQGESTFAGLPCTFVRLTGCDLRCRWCDSEYAFYGGTKKTLDAIVTEVKALQTPLVEITGGEPLLQKNVHPLMTQLCNEGFRVLIETSGAHNISHVDERVVRIVDLKCPSSGEMDKNRFENLEWLKPSDEIKFVIGTKEDFEWATEIIRKFKLTERCTVLFSAVWNEIKLSEIAEWLKDSGVNARLQPQLHKVLWGDRPSV